MNLCGILYISAYVSTSRVYVLVLYVLFMSNRTVVFQVVTDIERNDVDFIARTLHLQPIAHIDHFSADKLGSAGLAQEVTIAGSNSKVLPVSVLIYRERLDYYNAGVCGGVGGEIHGNREHGPYGDHFDARIESSRAG